MHKRLVILKILYSNFTLWVLVRGLLLLTCPDIWKLNGLRSGEFLYNSINQNTLEIAHSCLLLHCVAETEVGGV